MIELLEIKEFAERAGISRQSVYKAYRNPNSRLQPYVISTPKGPRINAQALVDIYDKPKQPQETAGNTTIHLETAQETAKTAPNQFAVENSNQPKPTSQDNQAQAAVLATLEVLTAQLQEKDKQIERLQLEAQALREAGAEKDKLIREQMKLLSQAQELVRNNQVLLAQGATASQATAAVPDTPAEDNPPVEQANIAQKKEKKSFFKWLFG